MDEIVLLLNGYIVAHKTLTDSNITISPLGVTAI